MDKRSGSLPVRRKFFTGKSDRSPSKQPQFDVRTVLFKADHLRAASTRSAPTKAYTYKFFASKNPIPAPDQQITVQTSIPNIKNGSSGAKRLHSPAAKKLPAENTENLTLSQSKASSDQRCVRTSDIKPASQPVKQSKRQRGEQPDDVNPSVITGRRSTRSHPRDNKQREAESRNQTGDCADESEAPTASSAQSPVVTDIQSESHVPSSPHNASQVEAEKLRPESPPHESPSVCLQPAAVSAESQHQEEEEQSEVPAVKPRKRFFRSKNSVPEVESKPKPKPQLDFKKFFNDDFEDSFVSTSDNLAKETAADEYVTMQRVRKAHQCQEMGETESFDEDIRYNLNGLEKGNSIRIRCLSIEALTSLCMRPEFRMHLRAHDDMPRIISALSDAPSDPNLAFCTAALMFVYNQDRLTMDIDPNHLSLMLDLLEVKEEKIEKEFHKKAKEQVEQMKSRGHGKFLDPSNLSAGKLALEALLGLTSKRAGDWFKEELRQLKGLDFLMNTVIASIKQRDRLHHEAELTKIDRTLRVLEAATLMHEQNQLYVIDYQDGQLIRSCTDLLNICKDSILIQSDYKIHLSTLLSVLRVFTNLTSESCDGSRMIGLRFENLLTLFLDLLFEVPSFVPPDARFDLMVLLLCLSISLVEFHEPLRGQLLKSHRTMDRLVQILISRVRDAEETEQQADDLLETAEKDQMSEIVNIDTLLNQVVAKSGKHMEHSIVAACVSLLLGCAIQDNTAGRETLSQLLPDNSFDPLIDVLRKLREFANLADIMTPSGVKRVEKVLRVFQPATEQQCVKNEPSSPSLMSISESFLNDTIDSIPARISD